jgi:two-component system cell cycle response regulator DivK
VKPTILIVEDDSQNRKLLSELLSVKGYRILEAHDGEQSLELAFTHIPDLVLMDIQLPTMDGYVAVQKLKADLRTCELPIWVLTAYAMSNDEARLRTCGCDKYFTKPLDIPSLLAHIECLFEADCDNQKCAKYPTEEDT